jgi:hypothetical protein
MGICFPTKAKDDNKKKNKAPGNQSAISDNKKVRNTSSNRQPTISPSKNNKELISDDEIEVTDFHGNLLAHQAEDKNIVQIEDKITGVRYSFNDFIKHRVDLS